MTWQENNSKAHKQHKDGTLNYDHKLVIQLTKSGEMVAEYISTSEAGRETRVAQSSISLCCNKKRKTAGGFRWEYANKKKDK